MKHLARVFVLLLVVALLLPGCTTKNQTTLNGTDISQFTLVYSQTAPDYCQRAAEYIQAQVLDRTGKEIPVCTAESGTYGHEIIVGPTDRVLSEFPETEGEKLEFYITADDNHIAMYGDYFLIAAAAYYFVETYIPDGSFKSVIPQEITTCQPITEKANNFIFLIGDGMGPNHTKLLAEYDVSEFASDSDNERTFYGNYLPYQGVIHTGSLSGITDSAAGATALACGYKTINSYVGRDEDGNDLLSLTELAAQKGMATAVMSTDQLTGATPAGFSAHASDRDDSETILACVQEKMLAGTIMIGGLQAEGSYQETISETLAELDKSENGFFIMYEEGYIDKFSHKKQLEDTLVAMGQFNQAIGIFMEYAFYHPDTFLIITADHETGGLMAAEEGGFEFHTESHTGADVQIFGYGQGAEVFAGYAQENNEVPKVIAKLWGVDDFGG